MSEKPEVLRLAEDFDDFAKRELYRYMELDKAADELRRQHAEIERLKAALTYDWDMLEACRGSLREHMSEIKRLKAERDEAVKAEREACARVAETHQYVAGWGVAAAIRARGQEDKT